MLALGEVDYDDNRFEMTPGSMESPSFQKAKISGELALNLNRAPVLITPEGHVIGQSKAIERYLARKHGLMGSSDVEAAQIDCVCEHIRDLKDAQIRKRFSMFVKDKSDEDKEADRKEWFEKDMPEMLSKIEQAIELTSQEKGCAVGSSISLADLTIFALLKDGFPSYKEATLKAAENCSLFLFPD